MTTTWRLIDTGPLDGVRNMAIDEALLRHFDPATSPPVLRLYGWQPAALSIGRFQKVEDDLDRVRISADRLTVVRRITGGGALYHADELTYAVICAPHQIPAASSVKDSFRVVTSFLLALYQGLGLHAVYAADAGQPDRRIGGRTPLCFAGTESYDILVNGRKLGGNAQRRQKAVIFQHGSIPLVDRWCEGLPYLRSRPEGLDAAVTSLATEGSTADLPELKQRLATCFSQQLGGRLQPDGLSAAEQVTMQRLIDAKYGAVTWNWGGEAV